MCTSDGQPHILPERWDMIIAFPPCTYLTVTGNSWFNEQKYGDKARERKVKRQQAAQFFMAFANANCEKIAIENPIGYMSTYYRQPTQIIQPYYFGHEERKATCLWLKGLPKLKATKIVKPKIIKYASGRTDSWIHAWTWNLPRKQRAKIRSKTFPGVAKAMAEQWAGNNVAEAYEQGSLF